MTEMLVENTLLRVTNQCKNICQLKKKKCSRHLLLLTKSQTHMAKILNFSIPAVSKRCCQLAGTGSPATSSLSLLTTTAGHRGGRQAGSSFPTEASPLIPGALHKPLNYFRLQQMGMCAWLPPQSTELQH